SVPSPSRPWPAPPSTASAVSTPDTRKPPPPPPMTPVDELAERRARRRHGGRMPPHDVEAERALLSAAMLDQAAAEQAAAVPTDAWWHPAHQAIAGAVAALVAAGDPTDAVTVADRLARDGLLDRVGGHEGLVDLAAAGGAPSAARHYSRIITRH